MAELLIDTSVFVDYLRGLHAAHTALARVRSLGPIRMHLASVAELQAGVKNRRAARETENLKGGCELIVPNEHDLRHSIALQSQLSLSHGVEWIDCLIAATAMRLDFEVVTRNDADFLPMRGLRVSRPY